VNIQEIYAEAEALEVLRVEKITVWFTSDCFELLLCYQLSAKSQELLALLKLDPFLPN